MIYVHEIEPGVLVRWPSGHRVMRTYRTSNLLRADGAVREVDDGPYEAEVKGLGGDLHTFSPEELADMKIYPAEAFPIPDGKKPVRGTEGFTRGQDRVVRQTLDVEDVPPPPTPAEKLAASGITPEEFETLVAAHLARQPARQQVKK